MTLIDPSEESRKWVEVIKKRWKQRNEGDGNQPKKKKTQDYRLSKEDFNYNEMAKHIQHRCNGPWKKYSQAMHPQERFPEYEGLEVPVLKVTFVCTSCLKRESVFLFSNGSMSIGYPNDLKKNTPEVPSADVKNGFKQKGFYVDKIKLENLSKYEDPRKFTTTEELQNFEQHFPEHRLGLVARLRAKLKGEPKNTKKRHRLLFNPGKCEYLKDIASLIKRISGCEVNLQKHYAADKKFAELKDHEKVLTFFFSCRYNETKSINLSFNMNYFWS